MTLALKLAIPCTIGVATTGLVSSNFVFKNKNWVILKDEDKEWGAKLSLLINKLSTDNNLAAKIDKTNSTTSLAITSTPATNPKKFTDEGKAKIALQNWCKSIDKGDIANLEKELCKVEKSEGWLFG